MLRVHCCLLCGKPLPEAGRMDRKYCGDSHRSLASRQRKRLGISPLPRIPLPCPPLRDTEEKSPAGVTGERDQDLMERVVALIALLDAAQRHNAELEAVVAQFATRESELTAQNTSLRRELAVAQEHRRELENRLQSSCTTQTAERTDAHPIAPEIDPAPMSRVQSSTESPAKTTALAPPAKSRHLWLDLADDAVRMRIATAVLTTVERGINAPGSDYYHAKQEWHTVDRGHLTLISLAVVLEVEEAGDPEVPQGGFVVRAVNRVLERMKKELPESVTASDRWLKNHMILVTLVTQTTLRAIRYLRERSASPTRPA